jgi:predicted HicB family RNase H-like nuclease
MEFRSRSEVFLQVCTEKGIEPRRHFGKFNRRIAGVTSNWPLAQQRQEHQYIGTRGTARACRFVKRG